MVWIRSALFLTGLFATILLICGYILDKTGRLGQKSRQILSLLFGGCFVVYGLLGLVLIVSIVV